MPTTLIRRGSGEIPPPPDVASDGVVRTSVRLDGGVGWNNPDVPWTELEAVLSGGRPRDGRASPAGPEADGGDSPAWSRKREPLPPHRAAPSPAERVPYAELHCHSNFSFLDGASHPEELVEQAARLGLDALALTDHDGMYGVVRFAEAAAELGVRHGVRRRALARALRPAERRGRPGGQPPAAAGPRPRGLPRRSAA